MKRILVGAALAGALLACGLDVTPLGVPRIILTPVLDTVFLGDQLVKRQVTFYDEHGNVQDPGAVLWSTTDTSVLNVDAGTGKVTGHGPGIGVLHANAKSGEGFAVIVVSPTLKVTLLIDTLLLMPGDTLTIPRDVKHEAPGSPTVWFSAAANAAFTLDSATGRVTANAVGGPIQVVAHAALAADTATDGGTIEVVQPSDTTAGSAYYTIFGTAQRARRVPVRGSVYPRPGDTLTLRLHLPTKVQGITEEAVDLLLRAPPVDAGVFPIDSIAPAEASGGTIDPGCRPPRNWGVWFTIAGSSRVDALSRAGGSLAVLQVIPVTGGFAMSGTFYFAAQRTDRYDDPTAVLPIRGSFVAPLITDPTPCH